MFLGYVCGGVYSDPLPFLTAAFAFELFLDNFCVKCEVALWLNPLTCICPMIQG